MTPNPKQHQPFVISPPTFVNNPFIAVLKAPSVNAPSVPCWDSDWERLQSSSVHSLLSGFLSVLVHSAQLYQQTLIASQRQVGQEDICSNWRSVRWGGVAEGRQGMPCLNASKYTAWTLSEKEPSNHLPQDAVWIRPSLGQVSFPSQIKLVSLGKNALFWVTFYCTTTK